MMKNYDESDKINQIPDWLFIPNDPYRISIIGSLGSFKTNAPLNLIKHQWLDLEKCYLSVKNPFKLK